MEPWTLTIEEYRLKTVLWRVYTIVVADLPRFRIRIRIRIEVKSWIRIRIKAIQNRNPLTDIMFQRC
jgi:hypothetical protein